MNCKNENGTEWSGLRTITGSNPSITTTRLAERQQITGLNTSTINRTQPTSP